MNTTPPLDEPTDAEPGTVEKLEVMIRRYAAGLRIFHPLDSLTFGERRENAVVLLNCGKREAYARRPRMRRVPCPPALSE